MLSDLLYSLRDTEFFFNLFGYISFRSGLSLVTSFFIVLILMPHWIRFQQSIFPRGQPIRNDGPDTHYHKKGACYKKHVDRGHNRPVRKLSVSIQLTESSLYEGCNLLLYNEETPHICKREIGSATVFPSYTLHEVTELQQGERFALVTWVTGESFK